LQEERAKEALKGLKSAGGYLRRELGSALNLRYTPELNWALDDSITYGAKMMKLINSLGVEKDETTDEKTDS
jgi:ribosome-binding factor A